MVICPLQHGGIISKRKQFMKKIYLFTLSFPYGKGEKSFITPELNELSKEYKITILSCARREQIEDKINETILNPNISVILLRDHLSGIQKGIYLLRVLFSPLLWQELFYLVKSGKSIYKSWYFIFSFYARACNIKKQLKRLNVLHEDAIYYTYWYNHCTLGLLFTKKRYKNIKVITRTHGYDLYHERCPGNWQPFKRYMTAHINAIFFACSYAKEYYVNTFLFNTNKMDKLYLARLGVPPKQKCNFIENNNVFELVSCSNVISIKRIELIIEALALCNDDMKLHWTHFGDGDLMQQIKRLTENKLASCKHISYTFYGHVSNQTVMDYYESHPVNCFITTSSTEGGCPVSIQEAVSYGIPVIGTAVGGILELVQNNGVLLSAVPTFVEVADAIKKVYYASEQQIQTWRDNSYKLWKEKFNSDENYKSFVKQITEL